MQSVNLFDLATQQARWLSARQAAVAGNIANANTPGYISVDVEPFEKVLAKASFGGATTQSGHVSLASTGGDIGTRQGDAPLLPTGNTVVMETELGKAGEIRRAFEMNTAIVKAFHRMTLSALKA